MDTVFEMVFRSWMSVNAICRRSSKWALRRRIPTIDRWHKSNRWRYHSRCWMTSWHCIFWWSVHRVRPQNDRMRDAVTCAVMMARTWTHQENRRYPIAYMRCLKKEAEDNFYISVKHCSGEISIRGTRLRSVDDEQRLESSRPALRS